MHLRTIIWFKDQFPQERNLLLWCSKTNGVMHHRQLLNSEWSKVEECFEKKLSCWKAKYLSYGGRLVLLNLVPSILPFYDVLFLRSPKGCSRILTTLDQDFFGKDLAISINIALSNGIYCAVPKTKGDLGS